MHVNSRGPPCVLHPSGWLAVWVGAPPQLVFPHDSKVAPVAVHAYFTDVVPVFMHVRTGTHVTLSRACVVMGTC